MSDELHRRVSEYEKIISKIDQEVITLKAKFGSAVISEKSWHSWSRYVLKLLESHSKCLNEVKHDVNEVKGDIKVLKFKSGLWGATSGAIVVVIALGLWIIKQ